MPYVLGLFRLKKAKSFSIFYHIDAGIDIMQTTVRIFDLKIL